MKISENFKSEDDFWYAQSLKSFNKACDLGEKIGCETTEFMRRLDRSFKRCFGAETDAVCAVVRSAVAKSVSNDLKEKEKK